MTLSPFLGWLHECVAGDQAFERAYGSCSPLQRSWLKLCLAQLHDSWLARFAQGLSGSRHALRHQSGFEDLAAARPLSWCLVLLDKAMTSPSRLLATVLPPIEAGVEHLLVLRLTARRAVWPAPLLTALELAGVEQAAQAPARVCNDLIAHLASCGPGVVLAPQPLSGLSVQFWQTLARTPGLRFWQPTFQGSAGILAEEGVSSGWNLDALAWCQPDLAFDIWFDHGAPGLETPALPPEWRLRRGGAAMFLEQGYELALAPTAVHGQALRTAMLALGPGQESGFVWPDLRPCIFHIHAASWTFSEDAPAAGAPGVPEDQQ